MSTNNNGATQSQPPPPPPPPPPVPYLSTLPSRLLRTRPLPPSDLIANFDLPIHQLFISNHLSPITTQPVPDTSDDEYDHLTTPSTPVGRDYLTSLPYEILLIIIKPLPLLTKITLLETHKRLRRVVLDPVLWTIIDFSSPTVSAFHQKFLLTQSRRRSLNANNDTPPSLSDIASGRTIIDTNKPPKEDKHLSSQELERLFRKIFGLCITYTGRGVKQLLLSGVPQLLSNEVLGAIGRNCHQLQYLQLTNIDHNNISLSGLESLFKPTITLRKLSLSNTKILNDGALKLIATYLHDLEEIDLSAYSLSSKITDLGVGYILQGCPKLREVVLLGCHLITDESIIRIADSWPCITKLDIQGCFQITDIGIRSILTSCTELRELDVSYIWRMTDEAFLGVAVVAPLMKLSMQFCYHLSDRSVLAIVEACSETLRYLNGSYCAALTEDARMVVVRMGIAGVFDGCKNVRGDVEFIEE